MKKIITLVTTLVLTGALYVSINKGQNEQSKQVAKEAQTQTMLKSDPGTGMG
ncbi:MULTISPECIES: hypothetical protein [Bacillus cereus group]|uniref:hypothetical protein n=1 Tax=Bacillus cereus group TaxID=86661 RepID=UPI0015597B42|nr:MULTISPECIES: hypothetical protein [Bacillus cereus group]MBJ8025232.1 hypothetical protein [Bacillus cereus]MBJ8037660.1 hypothetical protein [Bacillus cereus]